MKKLFFISASVSEKAISLFEKFWMYQLLPFSSFTGGLTAGAGAYYFFGAEGTGAEGGATEAAFGAVPLSRSFQLPEPLKLKLRPIGKFSAA